MVNLNAAGYPTLRGWGAPGVDAADLVTLDCPTAHNLPMRVRRQVALPSQRLVNELRRIRREHGKPELDSSGGYNKRVIAGTTRWSNHSWGLAMDFNAGANPYSRTLQFDFPEAETRQIANALGFRWGRDYVNQKFDPMHFEQMGTTAEVLAIVNSLGNIAVPVPVIKPAPAAPTAPSNILQRGDIGPLVLAWQGELWRIGVGVGIHDSNYGAATEGGTRTLQSSAGIGVDGIVGPQTRATATKVPNYPKAAGPALPLCNPGGPGDTIEAFQRRLKDRGWSIGVDGRYGGQTAQVISKFQAEKGLTIDGVGGPAVWIALWTRGL